MENDFLSVPIDISRTIRNGRFGYRMRKGDIMRLLALDSSGLVASVAIVEEEQIVAEYTINYKKTHSQTLLPMLDEIIKMTQIDLDTIDAIAIAGGPGSFTGLRIGSATAKGLGFALGKPLIHIPTVEALAYNLYGNSQVICPIMDARRNQVYTGLYEFHEMKFRVMQDQMAVSIEELIKELNLLGREVIFIGDGIPPYSEIIKEQMKVPYSFAPAHLCRQRAGAVGTLAIEYFKEGKIETATEHQPEYLRLSQAERELKEKMMAKEQS